MINDRKSIQKELYRENKEKSHKERIHRTMHAEAGGQNNEN